MRKYRKLEKKLNTANSNGVAISREISNNVIEVIEANKKVLEACDNLEKIVSDIDIEFAKRTSILNPNDQLFLWTAVALQTTRQFFQPGLEVDIDKPDIESRCKASTSDEKNKLKETSENFNDNSNESKFINKEEYYVRPVPYDAMLGEGAKEVVLEGIKKNPASQLHGGNHHAATLGHDPILGYIFGTLNIMTYTITFNKITLQTNRVELEDGTWNKTIHEEVGFFNTIQVAMEAEKDDYLRIPFALGRHQIHISTDVGTKMGVQIPFLPAKKQQALLEKGWNSEEVKKIFQRLGKNKTHNYRVIENQFKYAFFINMVIETLHLLMYKEEKDESIELYRVRTKRILAVSNEIASSINFAYFVGIITSAIITEDLTIVKKGIEKLDIGGYIEAVHQIVTSKKLQEKIRREYLEKRLYETFVGNEYTFVEEDDNE